MFVGFLAAPFLIPFFTAGNWEKGIKNGAARKFFGLSYFVTALECEGCCHRQWTPNKGKIEKKSEMFVPMWHTNLLMP